jgi:hypothetical protein
VHGFAVLFKVCRVFCFQPVPLLYLHDAPCCLCRSFSPQKFCLLLAIRLGYGLDNPGSESCLAKGFIPFSKTSRPALASIQSPVRLVLWTLSTHCKSSRGMGLTTHLPLVLRLRMCRAVSSLRLYAILVCTGMTS